MSFDPKHLTPYQILEVGEKASEAEIKRAWQLHSLAWYPDRFHGSFEEEATERFAAIKNAYDTLKNPALRMRLDVSLGIDDDDENQTDTVQFELPEQRNPDCWKRLAKWAKDEDKFSSKSRGFAYSVADKYLEKSYPLSQTQLDWAKNLWSDAIREGFDPGADE